MLEIKPKKPRIKHTIRTRDGGTKEVSLTRALAIKIFCTECMGYEESPTDCPSKLCALFPYKKKTRIAYDSKEKVIEEEDDDGEED